MSVKASDQEGSTSFLIDEVDECAQGMKEGDKRKGTDTTGDVKWCIEFVSCFIVDVGLMRNKPFDDVGVLS